MGPFEGNFCYSGSIYVPTEALWFLDAKMTPWLRESLLGAVGVLAGQIGNEEPDVFSMWTWRVLQRP